MVEAVGIEPTSCTFSLTGFAFIGVHYECIEVHNSMLFDKQVVSFGYVGSNYGRPLSPRTFQATLTVDF